MRAASELCGDGMDIIPHLHSPLPANRRLQFRTMHPAVRAIPFAKGPTVEAPLPVITFPTNHKESTSTMSTPKKSEIHQALPVSSILMIPRW